VRQRPKLLVGFSDITLLHNHLLAATGLISLHGPVLTTLSTSTPATLDRLYRCLGESWQGTSRFPRIEILRGGPEVRGTLVGGNLSSLVTLLGTSFDFSWQDHIVFLEDTNEPIYRLDRMLTQLALAGKFTGLAGILLGDFSLSDPQGDAETLRRKEWLWERVLDLTASSSVPVWAELPAGHCRENLTLPIGASTAMNSSRATLSFM
jgi:muramoyltetrapeptide carboxypeptidase